MRCFRAMTLVPSASGISSSRSGTAVVNLTVTRRGSVASDGLRKELMARCRSLAEEVGWEIELVDLA